MDYVKYEGCAKSILRVAHSGYKLIKINGLNNKEAGPEDRAGTKKVVKN